METKLRDFGKSVVKPATAAGQPTDRRAWSVPIAGIWVPFFLGTNVLGESTVSAEALGAPLRLAKEKDGSIKFSPSGRPVIRVAKELSDQVKLARENYIVGLQLHIAGVRKDKPEEYKAEAARAQAAGTPIIKADKDALDAYNELVKAAQEAARSQVPTPAGERELVAA